MVRLRMRKHSIFTLLKLAFVSILSIHLFASGAIAHETNPAIADVTVSDGAIKLELRLNVEAYLAGIDLSQVTDTDEAAEAANYDALAERAGSEIATLFRDAEKAFLSGLVLSVDGGEVPLALSRLEVPENAIPDVARLSLAVFEGKVSSSAASLVVTWPKEYGALVLRQQGVDDPYTGFLPNGGSSEAITLSGGNAQTGWQAFVSYIPVGFDHILPKGLDHILFVLGLFFLTTRMGPLLWQVSAFTLAHTVTLALGALGWVTISGAIVEPLIAASIVYVAVENIRSPELSRWRPIVIFGFGLLHGLGFASVLGDFGLPQGQFIPALIGFNVGVEVGQLTVIAIAFLAVGIWFGRKEWYRRVISIPASIAIAAIGAYWAIERVFF